MASSPDPFMPFKPVGSIKQSRSQDGKISNWFEDSFEFDKQTGRQQPMSYTKKHVGGSFTMLRAQYTISFLAFILFLILLRIFFLQVLHGDYYRDRAENNRKRNIPIVAERGTIYDRYGIALTKNIPNFALAITPQDLPRDKDEREKIVKKIAELTKGDESFIREQLRIYGGYSYESIVISEDLDYEAALSIQIEAGALPGIQIQRGSKRLYIHPGSREGQDNYSLSHVLGYKGKLSPAELKLLYKKGYLPSDTIGKTGIEKQYETELRGVYGRKQIEVDSRGREQLVLAQESPIIGKDIELTIDAQAQYELQRVVEKYLRLNNLTKAAAIVMDPNNGEVLALVSLPAYNNNDFSGGIDNKTYSKYISNKDRPLFNRAIGGTYPSGSTIKLAVALAALQEHVISGSTAFLSKGGIAIGQWFFPDWKAGGHGMTNVRKSLQDSVNTFYYIIGGGYKDFVGLGVDRITKYLRLYGFSQELGIDIPGEQSGFLPSKAWKQEVKGERWYIGDTYNLSIGQGDLLVTPLQIASLTSMIANNGTIYKPHIAKSFIDPVSREKKDIMPEILRDNLANPDNIKLIKQGMRDCVTSGSCRRLSLLPFSSGGKTGTAQWSSKAEPHAWFTALAPYEKPKVVVTVLVEEGVGGSKIAAPITYEFLRWWGNNRK